MGGVPPHLEQLDGSKSTELNLVCFIEREVQACGRDARGRRRWVCLGCGRTFGASTGTVLGRSELDRVTWHAYAGAMLAGASPGACASAAGVSLRTSFFMRHRLCEVMACTTPAPGARRGCRVLVDGFAVPDSLG